MLMASAARPTGRTTLMQDIASRIDARDGAGALDAEAALHIALARRSRGEAAADRGWDVFSLESAHVGPGGYATFSYGVAIDAGLIEPKAHVALCWSSAIELDAVSRGSSILTADLDLTIRNSAGTVVAQASSWDNSYEVVEFCPLASENYQIVIRRSSGTEPVWCGIAWIVRDAAHGGRG